ncbi:hypothetical protein BDR26DRAFT_987055 [Obelidium mucronatum]|nr:hypothetical protein BDR26DRAFT_987055 [Obelidium mucronatum]
MDFGSSQNIKAVDRDVLLETILSVSFIKINEQYYVTISFADLWLKHLPSGLLVKLYREQRTYSLAFPTIKVPVPDSAVIFKRGFYVYHMLLLQQYISKIPANDDYEHMRYTHFRPSWAPKTTHLWNNYQKQQEVVSPLRSAGSERHARIGPDSGSE